MKPRIVQQIVLLAVGLLLLSACKPKVPKEYIQPDEMEDLLYDYYVAQAMVFEPNPSESMDYRRQYNMELVLKKYGRTQADLDSSLVYYYIHMEDLYKIFEGVQKRLGDQALELGASTKEVERFTTQSLSGDTTEVWEGSRQVVLIPNPPYNIMQFTQKADTSYHQGDSFLMTFGSTFLVQSGSRNANLVLTVRYENDSIVSQNTQISSGVTTLHIPRCTLKAKELKGFVYMAKRQSYDNLNDMCVLLLDHIQLVKFHHQQDDEELVKPLVNRDSLRTDSIRRDSIKRSSMHRLGQRPMPVNDENTKSNIKPIIKR